MEWRATGLISTCRIGHEGKVTIMNVCMKDIVMIRCIV